MKPAEEWREEIQDEYLRSAYAQDFPEEKDILNIIRAIQKDALKEAKKRLNKNTAETMANPQYTENILNLMSG